MEIVFITIQYQLCAQLYVSTYQFEYVMPKQNVEFSFILIVKANFDLLMSSKSPASECKPSARTQTETVSNS